MGGGGGGRQTDHPQKKLTSKSPALLGLTAFKVGWSIFSDKVSKFSNSGILRLITAFEKKWLSHCTFLLICY